MEEFGIRVIELSTPYRIDGIAALFGSEFAVVLNPSTANDRARLNAAHELGHVLYGDCSETSKPTRAMDDRAFEFACNLLIPISQLREAFRELSAVRLVEAKQEFGISMAAMIYRAEKLKIINERTAKKLWIQFAKRGWRANEPGEVKQDRATRLEKLIDKAVFERKITWSEAAATIGVSRKDLLERMKMAVGRPSPAQNELEGGDSVPGLRLMMG
jgi:Zn-dependent peptidase ImmA (M78 family)